MPSDSFTSGAGSCWSLSPVKARRIARPSWGVPTLLHASPSSGPIVIVGSPFESAPASQALSSVWKKSNMSVPPDPTRTMRFSYMPAPRVPFRSSAAVFDQDPRRTSTHLEPSH
eukprot:scaffold146_cov265-Pinguiococcus_pyrenoidosus.AAC.4